VDKLFGTDQLLELLGAKKVDRSVADVSNDKTRQALGLALEARSKQVFLQVLGRDGGVALKGILNRCDPYNDAAGFTSACVAELEPLIGMESAKALMS
jgi:hypothetical protein